MDKSIDVSQNFVKELLEKLNIEAKVTATQEEELIRVLIESDESGILIGHHGRNLESLQTITGLVVFKVTGAWVRIVLDVGDYRERRQKQLEGLADDAITKIRETGEEISIPHLTPSERRAIHMYVSENTEVQTESSGEGRNRILTIKRKA